MDRERETGRERGQRGERDRQTEKEKIRQMY